MACFWKWKLNKVYKKPKCPKNVFDDSHEIFNLYNRERKVDKVKMLSEVKEPLLDLENCNLLEIISILQKIASDPSINVNQAGFGS